MDNKEIKILINELNYFLKKLEFITDKKNLSSSDYDDIKEIRDYRIDNKRGTPEFILLSLYINELCSELQGYNILEFKNIIRGIKKTLEIRNIIIELKN